MKRLITFLLLLVAALGQSPTGTYYGGTISVAGPSPWIDVMAKGVKCDGATDDTTAMQAILTSLQSTGGSIYFPVSPNGCKFTSGLTYTGATGANLHIFGQTPPGGGESSGNPSVVYLDCYTAGMVTLTIGLG